MIIARIDNFALATKNFIGEHEYTTHDIEIRKYEPVDKSLYSNPDSASDETCYTIANFNEDGELTSCGSRFMETLIEEDSWEAVIAVSKLIKIAELIINTPECESNYNKANIIKSWIYNNKTGLLDEVKKDE